MSIKQTNVYKRFFNTPMVIARFLAIVLWMAVTDAVWGFQGVMGEYSHLALLFSAPLAISLCGYMFALKVMVQRRIWAWGRTKFDSWEELSDFVHKCDGERLDRLVVVPDHLWNP